jgi:hypothetical protein
VSDNFPMRVIPVAASCYSGGPNSTRHRVGPVDGLNALLRTDRVWQSVAGRFRQRQRRHLVADDGCDTQGCDHRKIDYAEFDESQDGVFTRLVMPSSHELMRGNI